MRRFIINREIETKLNEILKTTVQISLFVLLICCICSSHLQTQKSKHIENLIDSCEMVTVKLDTVAAAFNEIKKEESLLIIIGGSAKKVSPRYNSNRISDAIKYLVRFRNIENEKIVYGIGQSSNELGYLRFYVNGELVDEIKTGGKGRICFGLGETFPLRKKMILQERE